eukprot:jgi/Botrbrau1/1642/Bobra.0185s0052.1
MDELAYSLRHCQDVSRYSMKEDTASHSCIVCDYNCALHAALSDPCWTVTCHAYLRTAEATVLQGLRGLQYAFLNIARGVCSARLGGGGHPYSWRKALLLIYGCQFEGHGAW